MPYFGQITGLVLLLSVDGGLLRDMVPHSKNGRFAGLFICRIKEAPKYMTALRIFVVILVLLAVGFAALVVMGSSLEPQTATVEVTLPNDSFAE